MLVHMACRPPLIEDTSSQLILANQSHVHRVFIVQVSDQQISVVCMEVTSETFVAGDDLDVTDRASAEGVLSVTIFIALVVDAVALLLELVLHFSVCKVSSAMDAETASLETRETFAFFMLGVSSEAFVAVLA